MKATGVIPEMSETQLIIKTLQQLHSTHAYVQISYYIAIHSCITVTKFHSLHTTNISLHNNVILLQASLSLFMGILSLYCTVYIICYRQNQILDAYIEAVN